MLATVGRLMARARWLVLGAWLVAAVVLNVAIPQLGDVIKRDTVPFLPDSAPVMQAYSVMGHEFSGGHAQGYAIVILENPRGLSDADQRYYADLAHRIAAARGRVVDVQDAVSHPELATSERSRDGRALYLAVGLRAPVGTPSGDDDAAWLRDLAAVGRPADLIVHVTGDTAVIADFQSSVQQSTVRTSMITVLLVVVILLVIYRSPVTPVIPLTTIGLSILVVRPLVALLGLHVIKVAAFTDTFILAIVFGAGTDYCIFMISRFKEQLARGERRGPALATAVARVGGAVTCSAATVVVGGMAMMPANVSLFSTTGPAIAVAVAVTLLAGLTLTPALIAIGGVRFFWPQRLGVERPSRFWTGAAALVTARPRRVLVACLVPLLVLAALAPTMRQTYNERAPQPTGNDSMQGLAAIDRHFQSGEVLPDYVVVRSDHDLRNARDIATLDGVTRSLSHVDGVTSVRGFTQPQGTRVTEASVPYQAGQVGAGLQQAQAGVQQGTAGTSALGAGATALSGGAAQLASGAHQASGAAGELGTGLAQEGSALQQLGGGASNARDGAVSLQQGAASLAGGLGVLRAGLAQAVDGIDQVLLYFRTDPDPGCTVPSGGATPCQRARTGLQAIDDAERGQILPGLDQAIAGARAIATGSGNLAGGLGALRDGLALAQSGAQRLASAESTFASRLQQMSGGADQVSAGAGRLGGGIGRLAGGGDQLAAGLAQASASLAAISSEAQQAGIDTFFVPSGHLDDPQLALARYYYMSPDGTTARLLVYGADDPFGLGAMDRVQRERAAAETALKGTTLASAQVLVGGDAALNDSLRTMFTRDFGVVALAVMAGVLLVLVLLLRSLVAPLYLLASVLLSYAAAMGVTTLVWQDLLGRGAVDWTVAIFAFMMLVSVGADYNIFLMSRVREEVRRDPVDGIRHAVTRTGAIITSAGVIFAGTFAALVTSPLSNIAETGFAITCGLLLDTFVVRSFLVPAVAVVLGRWNWWPAGSWSHPFGSGARERVAAAVARPGTAARSGLRPR